ncbi:hypothetical protein BKA70DRAFT_1442355 [Coprinopsis sp. MPI-PUGE-AT-0042]|nr:hypothetical protein BKA70DRAFT_1442355 [Coprinopsis sp. MPI-PUGE-AT-0042]
MSPAFRNQSTDVSIKQVTSSNTFDGSDKLADFAAAERNPLEAVDVEGCLGKALFVLQQGLIDAEPTSGLGRDVDSEIIKRQRYT